MEEEDASELKFGVEFNDVQFLSNAEVVNVLTSSSSVFDHQSDVFQKSVAHCQRFCGFTETSVNVSSLKVELQNKLFESFLDDGTISTKQLHQFEVVSLLNLDPEEYDESLSLIPSLSRFNEDEIESLLTLLSKAKTLKQP